MGRKKRSAISFGQKKQQRIKDSIHKAKWYERDEVTRKSGIAADAAALYDAPHFIEELSKMYKEINDDPAIKEWYENADVQIAYCLEDANKTIKKEFGDEVNSYEDYAELADWALFDDQMYYDKSFKRYLSEKKSNSDEYKNKYEEIKDKLSATKDIEGELDSELSKNVESLLDVKWNDDAVTSVNNIIKNSIGFDRVNSVEAGLSNPYYSGVPGVNISYAKDKNKYYYNLGLNNVVKEAYEKYKKL